MRPRRRVVRWCRAAALVGCCAALAGPVRQAGAQPRDSAPPSAADREAAQRAFAQGQRAYRLGDFRHAAEAFESAYAHVPHPDALWNAARAWHKARELSRAANLYARYLREAAPGARDRNSATAALKDLAPRIARIDVVAPDFTELAVDSQPIDGTSVYVTPGEHVVEGKYDGRPVRQLPRVAAGDVVSVALSPPAAGAVASASTPTSPSTSAPTTTPTSTSTSTSSSASTANGSSSVHAEGSSVHLSPLILIVGGIATAALGGVTLWSGLDTLSARSHYDGTQQSLDDGLSKEHRTNILLGATVGVGAVTLITALALNDWHAKAKQEPIALGVGPGSVALRGSF